MFENITKSIGESAEGWRMGIASLFGGVSAPLQKTEIGTAIIGPGFSAAQQRFAVIKAGGVSAQAPGTPAPVGVRYMSSTRSPSPVVGPKGNIIPMEVAPPEDPGTPATVIETIQKSIGESAEGWRMGFAHVAAKAKAGIEKSVAGWQWGISEAGSKVSESFGNVGDWFKSARWQMLLPVIILGFIAVMVAVGYSGVGGPAARIAEREYVKRR